MDLSMAPFVIPDEMLRKPISEDTPCVVIDLGTRYTKAGFSVDSQPCAVFPTAEAQTQLSFDQVQLMGDEGSYADVTELVLNYTFTTKLRINPENQPLLIGRSLPYVQQNRSKLLETLFEKFKVPKMMLPLNNALSLYSTGHLTGVSVELGAGTSYCVPMFDGFPLHGCIMSSEITGNKLTEYFMNLMSKHQQQISTLTDPVVIEQIKENTCSIAPNLFSALTDSPEIAYELPDGNTLSIGNERYQCPEAMFNPNLIPAVTKSIPQIICESVKKVEKVRGQPRAMDVVKNVLLSGGNAKFTNMCSRVKDEIDITLGDPISSLSEVNVHPLGQFSAWVGGSILCSHSNFNAVAITAEEYLEHGENITYLKSFY